MSSKSKRPKFIPTTDLGWEIRRYLNFSKGLIIVVGVAFVGWAISGRFKLDSLGLMFEALFWACAAMSWIIAVFTWRWNKRFRAQDPKDRRL